MYARQSQLGKRKRRAYVTRRSPLSWKQLSRKTRAVALARTGGFTGGRFELKYHDESLQGHAVTNDMTVGAALAENAANGQLCGIVQGTASNQRIGRCAYLKSVYIQGHIRQPLASALENSGYVTIWVVEDKQTNGAQMTAQTFLADVIGTSNDADAMQNLQFSDRFNLIAKKVVRCQPRNTAGNGTNYGTASLDTPFKIFKKINIKKEHAGVLATVADCTTSTLHVITIRSESMHATTEISYNARVRFTD